MGAIIAFLLIVLKGGVLLPVCSVLFIALYQIVSLVESQNQFYINIALIGYVLSLPLSCALTFAFINRFTLGLHGSHSLRALSFVMPLALCFAASNSEDFLIAALNIVVNDYSNAGLAGLFVWLLERMLFCGAVAAFCIISIQLLFELPILWCCNAFGFTRRPAISLEGLRVLSIITLLSFSAHLVGNFMVNELWPKGLP